MFRESIYLAFRFKLFRNLLAGVTEAQPVLWIEIDFPIGQAYIKRTL